MSRALARVAVAVALVATAALALVPRVEPAAATGGTATVVVDYGDSSAPVVRQVSITGDSITGIEALEGAGFRVVRQGYSALGTAVCGIWQGDALVGCPAGPGCLTCAEPEYWAYFQDGRKSPVGAGATEVRPGDVEQWAWGTAQAPSWPPSTTTTTASTTAATTKPPGGTTEPGAVSGTGSGTGPTGGPSAGGGGSSGSGSIGAGTTGSGSATTSSGTGSSTTSAAGDPTGASGRAASAKGDGSPSADERAAPPEAAGSTPGSAGDGDGGGSGLATMAGLGAGVAVLGTVAALARRRRSTG